MDAVGKGYGRAGSKYSNWTEELEGILWVALVVGQLIRLELLKHINSDSVDRCSKQIEGFGGTGRD